MKYQNVDAIAITELAGCLKTVGVFGNFSTVRNRLRLMIALRFSLRKAEDILCKIEKEAADLFIPLHEYVINELQYEYRYPNSAKYESDLLIKWGDMVAPRFGSAAANDFINIVLKNRTSRRVYNDAAL